MKTNEELWDEFWSEKYNVAMQFRDWQTCDTLHDKKGYLMDGFLAACETKDKIINQKIEINKSEALLNTSLCREYIKLERQLEKAHTLIKLIAGDVEFYCEVGERNKQAVAQDYLKQLGQR